MWTLKNGSAVSGASTLDPLSLRPFAKITPPLGKADVTKGFTINQTDIVTWVMDGHPYAEPSIPVVYGSSSDGWNASTTLHLPSNSTIDIIMVIANDSMDLVSSIIHSSLPKCVPKYLRLTLGGAQDGSSHASSRTQILGLGFWKRILPLLLGSRSSVVHDQSTEPFLS